jgi:hypothetical protein
MSCARTHEIEAGGRIAESRGLDAHIATCSACRARKDQLDAIARAVRAQPVPPDDELAARRERHRLVEAFDAELRGPRSRWTWKLVGVVAIVPAIVALVLVVGHGSSSSPIDAVAVSGVGARWTRSDDGATTRVTLDDGTLAIHVDHREGAPRLVVGVPDGEIDDLGTTFEVSVRNGHVASVAVREGALVLRLRDHEAIVITAGHTWTSAPETAHLAPPPQPAATSAVVPPPPATAKPRAASPRASATPLAIDVIDRELAKAVAALDSARYELAVRTLRVIVAEHRDDPRAEDAAYLLVVANQRSGDANATREAARAYLREYPRGFRRAAVQAIAK